jgi:hypothetical protein
MRRHSSFEQTCIIAFRAPLYATEHPEPQQVKVRPAEHDPGLSLQAVDLRFDLSTTDKFANR